MSNPIPPESLADVIEANKQVTRSLVELANSTSTDTTVETIEPVKVTPPVLNTRPIKAIGTRVITPELKLTTVPPIISVAKPDIHVPRGYCFITTYTHRGDLELVSHGAGTLLANKKGEARYVLCCAHLACSVDPSGQPVSSAHKLQIAIRPPHRQYQELVLTSDEVWVHSYYEGAVSGYRFDLSIVKLPNAVDASHAISRHDMRLHTVNPGERLAYYGLGYQSPLGEPHSLLHKGHMVVTDRSMHHIAELELGSDQFEQGFSGGPLYDMDNSMAWSGVISHFTPQGDGTRLSYIIPAQFALEWADSMIDYLEGE